MNQKKCPKCGENNPAEAVMCWACYTPLSGAPVASGPIPGSTPAPGEAPEKKPIAPWQIGVIGLALLIAAGFGISTLMGGGTVEAEPGGMPPIPGPGPVNTTGTSVATGPGVTVEVPAPQPGGGGTTAPVPDPKPSYTVTTQPSPKWEQATIGIVPSRPGVSEKQAAELARALGTKMRGGPWKATHIYVFADQATARTFEQYQNGRDGKPLDANDYAQLSNIWPSTLVRYEINGNQQSVRYPTSSPRGWWTGSGRRG